MHVIVDHQLRKESNLEANYIKNYLFSHGISSIILKVKKDDIEKKTMEEARINRFKCLLTYCKKFKILHLFLAHHSDDNLETFLIRKIAGSNFEGLSGFKDRVIINNLRVLRPLIDFKKKDILTFNKINKIKFILDPSNKNFNYTRSIVRDYLEKNICNKNHVEKDFKKINENFSHFQKVIFKSFNESLIQINDKSIFIDTKVFFLKDKIVQSKIIEITYKYLKFSRKPPDIRKYYLC